MENTTRDRTEEHRDRDNSDGQAVPPPRQPAPNASAHVPGGATELAELTRALEPETVGDKGHPQKGS